MAPIIFSLDSQQASDSVTYQHVNIASLTITTAFNVEVVINIYPQTYTFD